MLSVRRLLLFAGMTGLLSLVMGFTGLTMAQTALPLPRSADRADASLTREDQALLAQGMIPAKLRTSSSLYFTVNTTDDTPDAAPGNAACADASGHCSLRAAVDEGNQNTSYTLILIPSGTYPLTTAIEVSTTGTISLSREFGATEPVIIDGNDSTLLFKINAGARVAFGELTLTNGIYTGGGAISLAGTAYLYNTTISSSQALGGGAVLVDTTGYLEATNSAFYENHSGGHGGAIFIGDGEADFINVTISGNDAVNQGGGVYITGTSANVTFENVTIADNEADLGGGLAKTDNASVVTLFASILATNTAITASPDCKGTNIRSNGWTIQGSDSGCTLISYTGDQINVNPLLSPLQDNGGPTLSHLPLLNSPARDRDTSEGLNSASCQHGTDQRGVSRPHDGDYDGLNGCDIGAVEYVAPFTLLSPVYNDTLYSYVTGFAWSAKPEAVKYKFALRGVDNAYSSKAALLPADACDTVICSLQLGDQPFPGKGKMEWRVVAKTAVDKTASVWSPFQFEIPYTPQLYGPVDRAEVLDTTPTLYWNYDSVTSYRLMIFDGNTGAKISSRTFSDSSTPSIADVCQTFPCRVSTSEFGLTLESGKSYRWQIQATLDTPVGAYKSKSAKWTFTVLPSAPGLNALPEASSSLQRRTAGQ